MESINIRGLRNSLIEAWIEAALDLGVRVTAPAELRDLSGELYACEALVHDFGSSNGAVVVSPKTERRIRAHLRNSGPVWLSVIPEKAYPRYARTDFIDILNDWRWFGKAEERPAWDTGEPWR